MVQRYGENDGQNLAAKKVIRGSKLQPFLHTHGGRAMSEVAEVRFVDDARKGLVDHLLNRYRELESEETSCRVVVLEGESGAGKSRIVREFYKRLREDFPDGYWPELPPKIESQGFAVRKYLGPGTTNFSRGQDALPSYSWWTVTCEKTSGADLVPVTDQLLKQAQAHAPFYARKIKKESLPAERFNKWTKDKFPQLAKEAGTEAGIEGLSQLLSLADLARPAADVVLPGLGFALNQGVRITQWQREESRTRKRIQAGGALEDPQTPPELVYQNLAGFTHRKFPMVIAIEDLHLMQEDLSEVLHFIAEDTANHPMLVVATAWPDTSNKNYVDFFSQAGGVEKLEMSKSPLSVESLSAIVRELYPDTPDDVCQSIAHQWGNPYALQLLLTGDDFKEECLENDTTIRSLTNEDLAHMPRTIMDLFGERWNYLQEEERTALMAAIVSLPSESVEAPSSWPFIIDVVAQARARTIGTGAHEDEQQKVQQSLRGVSSRGDWLLEVQPEKVSAFSEWALAITADEKSKNDRRFQSSHKREELQRAIAEILSELIKSWTDDQNFVFDHQDEMKRTACAWLLAIDEGDDLRFAKKVAAFNKAARETDDFNYVAALEIVESVNDVDQSDKEDKDQDLDMTIATEKSRWLANSGQLEKAIALAEDILVYQDGKLGPNDRRTLATRRDIATWLGRLGNHSEAIAKLRKLLADRQEILNLNDPDTLDTWNDLANDHVETVHNLAHALAESGAYAEAITVSQAVLERHADQFGEAQLLALRQTIASWNGQLGNYGEAIAELQALLPDQENALEPNNPHIRRTIGNLETLRNAPASTHEPKQDLGVSKVRKNKRVRKQGRSGNPAKRAAEERDRKQ